MSQYTPSEVHEEPAGAKGVVYRLVDDLQNDMPYDFHSMAFVPYGGGTAQLTLLRSTEDGSLTSKGIKISPRFAGTTGQQQLNGIVFTC